MYSIITKSKYSYNYHIEEEISIWNIQLDSIHKVYSTSLFNHTSSGGWRYFHSTTRVINFQNGSFPKPLIIKQKTVDFTNMEITQEGDTIAGTKTTISGPVKIDFDYNSLGLTIRKIKDQTIETKRELEKKK